MKGYGGLQLTMPTNNNSYEVLPFKFVLSECHSDVEETLMMLQMFCV